MLPVYDSKAAAVEKAYIDSIKSTMPDLSKLSIEDRFPLRPAYGSKGQAITVWANYFELHPPAKLIISRYSMAIDDGEIAQQRRKKRQVINLVLKEIPGFPQRQHQIATDFADNLITVGEIPGLSGTTIKIRYQEDDEDEPKPRAKEYNVTFEKVASYDIDDVIDFLNSTDIRALASKQDIIGALNIWLRYFAKASDNIHTVGAKAIPTNTAPTPLGNGLSALKGFFSSVRFASSRILVNVNVSGMAFYNADLVPYVMNEYGTHSLIRLEKFLKGLRVELTHIAPKKKGGKLIPRIKTIWGFARRNDGSADTKPPKVKTNGAGAKDVEFFLNTGGPQTQAQSTSGKGGKGKGKGGGAGKGPAGDDDGHYISVYDYFKTRKLLGSVVSARLIPLQIIRLRLPIRDCPSSMLAQLNVQAISLRKSAKSLPGSLLVPS